MNEGAPLGSVSVVVPTYNRAGLLPATLRSIFAQTRPADEILVVDDGSTDETATVCAGFEPRVRYIRQENEGVSEARNKGVRLAHGEWIAFVDSDDLWDPRKLEIQLAAHEAVPEAGWSISECVLIDDAGKVVPGDQGLAASVPVFRELGVTSEEFFASALRPVPLQAAGSEHRAHAGDLFAPLFQGNVVLPSAVMIRRQLFDELGGFNASLRVAEDTEFFHRVAARSPVVVLMTPLLRWRVGHGGRLTDNENVRSMVLNALESAERAARLRNPLSAGELRAYHAGRQRLLLKAAYLHLSLLEVSEARRAVRSAWSIGAGLSLRSTGILAASLLPLWFLRAVRGVKSRGRD